MMSAESQYYYLRPSDHGLELPKRLPYLWAEGLPGGALADFQNQLFVAKERNLYNSPNPVKISRDCTDEVCEPHGSESVSGRRQPRLVPPIGAPVWPFRGYPCPLLLSDSINQCKLQ